MNVDQHWSSILLSDRDMGTSNTNIPCHLCCVSVLSFICCTFHIENYWISLIVVTFFCQTKIKKLQCPFLLLHVAYTPQQFPSTAAKVPNSKLQAPESPASRMFLGPCLGLGAGLGSGGHSESLNVSMQSHGASTGDDSSLYPLSDTGNSSSSSYLHSWGPVSMDLMSSHSSISLPQVTAQTGSLQLNVQGLQAYVIELESTASRAEQYPQV